MMNYPHKRYEKDQHGSPYSSNADSHLRTETVCGNESKEPAELR